VTTKSGTLAPPSRSKVWEMFDRIAGSYDLLNRLLSCGMDIGWRRTLCKHLPAGPLNVLDMATGTADVLLEMDRKQGRIAYGVGSDMSWGMLSYGNEKVRARNPHSLTLVRSSAICEAFASESFDAVSISFGIRNVMDVNAGLREMHRVLRPGGRALILEFSLPANPIIRAGSLFYFRNILPRIGGLISGDFQAYKYLNETVETFPYGEAFCALMRDAGFIDVRAIPLTFGIATLYLGDKPKP